MCLFAMLTGRAEALIFGGVGNAKVDDPGWPEGADKVFNVQQRVAWWEGPPLGGGEWHGECRGETADFNRVLADFAAIAGNSKRLVIHDGVGRSFWLDPNRTPDKDVDARIDWVFVVWVTKSFEQQRQLPPDLRATGEAVEPVSQIDVYTGGNIRWDEVKLPEGIEVIDNRLKSHGFSLEDGTVFEGFVSDLTTQGSVSARVELQFVQPKEKGGYEYTTKGTTTADESGRWVMRSVPAGWHRVVVSAPGFVGRVAGYYTIDDQPRYQAISTGLAHGGSVSGRMIDAEGRPLPDVKVDVRDISAPGGGRYELAGSTEGTTGADGTFLIREIPVGKASIRMSKPGYVRPGLGPKIEVPAAGLEYTLIQSAEVVIVVDFDGVERPEGYMVSMEPEGGSVVGSWGGSGNIDADGAVNWKQIPPGRYVIFGRPNPGNAKQQTESVTVELKGGEKREVVLKAR